MNHWQQKQKSKGLIVLVDIKHSHSYNWKPYFLNISIFGQIFNIFQHLFRTKMTMYSTKPKILSVAWLMIPWLILYLWDQSTYRFSASYLLQCIMQDAWCITIYHFTTLVYHFTTLVGLIFMKTNIPKFSLPPHKSKSSPRNLRWT